MGPDPRAERAAADGWSHRSATPWAPAGRRVTARSGAIPAGHAGTATGRATMDHQGVTDAEGLPPGRAPAGSCRANGSKARDPMRRWRAMHRTGAASPTACGTVQAPALWPQGYELRTEPPRMAEALRSTPERQPHDPKHRPPSRKPRHRRFGLGKGRTACGPWARGLVGPARPGTRPAPAPPTPRPGPGISWPLLGAAAEATPAIRRRAARAPCPEPSGRSAS